MPITLNGTTGITFPDGTTQVEGLPSPVPVIDGGTGLSSPGTAGNVLTSNGTSWVSSALPASGFSGATTNAPSSSFLTLTNSSSQYQVVQITNSANSYVVLPDATTVTAGTPPFVIENRSPLGLSLEIRSNSGASVGFITAGTSALVSLTDKSTSSGVWRVTQLTSQFLINYDQATATYNVGNSFTNAVSPIYVPLTSTQFIRWWVNGSPNPNSSTNGAFSFTVYAQVGTISGTTISYGSITNSTYSIQPGGSAFKRWDQVYSNTLRLSNTQAIGYLGIKYTYDINCNGNDGSTPIFFCMQVSGGTVSFGSSQTITYGFGGVVNQGNYVAWAAMYNPLLTRVDDSTFAVFYNSSVVGSGNNTSYNPALFYNGNTAVKACTVSGTTITVGSETQLASTQFSHPSGVVALTNSRLLVTYGRPTASFSDTGTNFMVVCDISGTTATWYTPVAIDSGGVNTNGNARWMADWKNLKGIPISSTQAYVMYNNNTINVTVSGTVPSLTSGTTATAFPAYSSFLLSSSSIAVGSSNPYNYIFYTSSGFYNVAASNIFQTNASLTSADIFGGGTWSSGVASSTCLATNGWWVIRASVLSS